MVLIQRKLPRGEEKGVYVDGYLNEILNFYAEAVAKHNTSVVIIFDGRSGMGKTTLNNQVGIILDPNYDLKNIHYTPQSFLDALAVAKPGDYICFDEAMLLSNRSTMSQINRMIIIAMSMIRSKKIFVSFCVNSVFDLDRNIAMSRADILLHVYGDTLIDRGKYAAFFKARDGENRLQHLYLLGKKFYSYSKPRANFVASFTKDFIVDEIEYEKRKQEGINNFLKGIEPKDTVSSRKKEQQRDLAILLLQKAGYSQAEIGKEIGISPNRISEILGKISETRKSPIENY